MGESERRVEELFRRYYNGTASPEQTEELMAYIRSVEDNDLLEQFLKKNWAQTSPEDRFFAPEKSAEMLNSILASAGRKEPSPGRVIRVAWLRYAAAAAAALVLVGLAYWWQFQTRLADDRSQAAVPASPAAVKPGGNRARLTLANGSAIELDRVRKGLLARQGAVEVLKTQDGVLVYRATADRTGADSRLNTLTTPKGGQYQVLLPDGSKVWLNASSTLRFPTVFPASERKVEITGEAYFEVARDKTKPFRVRFNTSEVQVLGTSFNIMAYPEEGPSRTTLVEGSVRISDSHRNAALRPGQQAVVLASGQIRTKFIAVDEAIAWRNGMFYFKEAGIDDVMRQLARWYNVKIEYRDKVPLRQFTGKIARSANLSEVTGMLQYAGVNCHLEGRTLVVDP